ncbi:MAG: YaaA family protein [Alphaproteobacteria bacterium]
MIIISPSKNLNIEPETVNYKFSEPKFKKKIKILSENLKGLSISELQSLMPISDKLIELNKKRFVNFDNSKNLKKPAAFLFTGATFDGLSIRSLEENLYDYAQKKLRILSGLYGILKPFDVIQPYRLEMGTNTVKLINSDLYKFWREDVSKNLNEEIKINGSTFLFNLSSKEYFSVLNHKKISAKVINFDFKTKLNDEYKNIGMQIKKMRGSMAKFIIDNRIESVEPLKNFQVNNFKFDKILPETNTLLFTS